MERKVLGQLDDWQRAIGAHFYLVYAQDRSMAGSTDHYMYLLPGLLGLSLQQVSQLYFELALKPIGGTTTPDALLEVVEIDYKRVSERNPQEISLAKTTGHEFRAFAQTSGSSRSIIDIWVGAGAVCASIAIVLAHFNEVADVLHYERGDDDKLRPKAEKLNFKLIALNRLVQEWTNRQAIVFDRYSQLEADSAVSRRARSLFVDSLRFLVLHEFAHHFLGHLAENLRERTPEWRRHQQEFEADADAIAHLVRMSNNIFTPGPLIVYMAVSLLRQEDDCLASQTHPALTDRVEHYVEILSEMAPSRESVARWVDGYLVRAVRTIFLNLLDRDRLPAWFGHTREEFSREISRIIPASTDSPVFQYRPFEFNVQMSFLDQTRPRAAGRRLDMDFI